MNTEVRSIDPRRSWIPAFAGMTAYPFLNTRLPPQPSSSESATAATP
jgi:hypothetical protein